jgi:chorismate mutase
MKNQISILRKQIDEIDEQIVNLLAERMKVVKKVGVFKKKQNIPPLDANRWQQVLNSKMEKAKSLGLDQEVIKGIYEIIHEFALKIEKLI